MTQNYLAISDTSITNQDASVVITSMADSNKTLSGLAGPIGIINLAMKPYFAVIQPQDTLTIADSNFGIDGLLIENLAVNAIFTKNGNFRLLTSGIPSVTAT